jgi:hypothetical protein
MPFPFAFPFSTVAPSTIIFPPEMVRGDCWSFELYAPKYAGDDAEGAPWTASSVFATGTVRVSTTATVQGDTFYWLVPSTETAKLPPGPASYVVQVTNATCRYTIDSGAISVADDINNPALVVDPNSMLEKQLAAADACLLALLGQRTQMVSFAGKQYSLWNVKDLWTVRNGIYSRVMAEREAAAGNMRARIICPVFTNI